MESLTGGILNVRFCAGVRLDDIEIKTNPRIFAKAGFFIVD
jgi:hypothetical protein